MSEQVWDAFLTERDAEHAATQSRAGRRMGERPVLLMIDIYKGVFGDSRKPLMEALATWPSSCGESAWDALPRLERLLGAFRKASIPVVHVTGDESMPGWREPRGGSHDDEKSARQRRAANYTIMDRVAPTAEELVLKKAAPSAFFGTSLLAYLRHLNADHVVIGGESTSGCVRATVVDACSYRYSVTVVEDCVFDRTEASHAMSLFDMAQKYATVEKLSELLSAGLPDCRSVHGQAVLVR